MDKFFRENPAIVLSLFVGYIVWIGLLWESAFLNVFGISPVDYASIQDLFSFPFRRPDRLIFSIGVFTSFFTAPFIYRLLIPNVSQGAMDFSRLTAVFLAMFFSVSSIGGSAESYAKKIKIMTPESITNGQFDSLSSNPVLDLVVADITMNRKFDNIKLKDQVIISKLGNNIFSFDLETKHLLIVSQLSVASIEVTHVPTRKGLEAPQVVKLDSEPDLLGKNSSKADSIEANIPELGV